MKMAFGSLSDVEMSQMRGATSKMAKKISKMCQKNSLTKARVRLVNFVELILGGVDCSMVAPADIIALFHSFVPLREIILAQRDGDDVVVDLGQDFDLRVALCQYLANRVLHLRKRPNVGKRGIECR